MSMRSSTPSSDCSSESRSGRSSSSRSFLRRCWPTSRRAGAKPDRGQGRHGVQRLRVTRRLGLIQGLQTNGIEGTGMSSPGTALDNVLYEKKGAIAYVTVNRPKVLNALSQRTWEDLRAAF